MTSDAVISVGLLTLCTLAIPAVLVTWGAARAGERATAMIGSFEFAVAVVAGWTLQGDQLSLVQVSGVSLVLASALYAAGHARSDDRTAAEPSARKGAPGFRGKQMVAGSGVVATDYAASTARSR